MEFSHKKDVWTLRDVSWMILNIICDFCFIYKLMAAGPILIFDWLKFQQLYPPTPHVQLLYDECYFVLPSFFLLIRKLRWLLKVDQEFRMATEYHQRI